MERYILRFKGVGEKPVKDIERIRSLPNSKIIDHTDRMVLVEAPASKVAELAKALPDWTISPEYFVPVPDTRPKLRKSTKNSH